jgi:hypothetical protein
MGELLSQLWFHGALGTGEAERLLKGRDEGTFLIRFSTTQAGSYTISKVKVGVVFCFVLCCVVYCATIFSFVTITLTNILTEGWYSCSSTS